MYLKFVNRPPDTLRKGRVYQTKREAANFAVVLRHLPCMIIAVKGTETPGNLVTDVLCREYALSKKDLDELISNSMHCIVPSFSDPFEIVCCDPETKDIKKAAFLRSVELLIFIHDRVCNWLNLYMSPKLGSFLRGSNPIRTSTQD